MEEMPRATADKIISLAIEEGPFEVCGFVMTDWSIVPAKNVSSKPHKNFEIDPATQLELVRTRRSEILGVYHSHPSGHTHPSQADLHGWPAVPHFRYWIATRGSVTEWRKKGHEFSESAEFVGATKGCVARKISTHSGDLRRARKRGIALGG